MAKKGRSTTLVGDRARRSIRYVVNNPWRAVGAGVFIVAVAFGGEQIYQAAFASAMEDSAKRICGAYGVKASIDTAHCIARNVVLPAYGYNSGGYNLQNQMDALDHIYDHESGWRYNADNPYSPAYGIPQANPGTKMATVPCDHGDGIHHNWEVNATCQIHWGVGYIKGTYGSPTRAWAFWQAHGWY